MTPTINTDATINERLIPEDSQTSFSNSGETIKCTPPLSIPVKDDMSTKSEITDMPLDDFNAILKTVEFDIPQSCPPHNNQDQFNASHRTIMTILEEYQTALDQKQNESHKPQPNSQEDPPPGSLLHQHTRSPSPTNVCDFPYFDIDDDNKIIQQQQNIDVYSDNCTILPKIRATRTEINKIIDDIDCYMEEESVANTVATEVTTYNIVADMGTYARTFIISKCATACQDKLADSGANCCMTADLKAMKNVTKLPIPITIGLAVTGDTTNIQGTECTHVGELPIQCDDGTSIYVRCFYNPNATDTIISPQAIVDSSEEFTEWKQTGRRMGDPGILTFIGPSVSKSITLHQNNGLYYCNPTTIPIDNEFQSPVMPTTKQLHLHTNKAEQQPSKQPKRQPPPTRKFRPTSKAKILESETWYLRMGGCNETQLEALPRHSVGLPTKFEWHPFRFIDFKEQARVRKQPAGRNPIKVARRGRRFYMDYGFMRASNDDFTKPSNKTDRIVESFDGYTSYLLIVDETSKYSWIFLTKSKDPPVEICKMFMKEFGHDQGGCIRCDQGGELARSMEWRTAMKKEFNYTVEPTGADSPSQNGQVERYNDTVATIVRTLLYGAHLPAKYWSAAAVHAVYLMNRRVHSATGETPYEGWWDELPDLSRLRVFGSRVCVKVTGKRRAKLDRHDFSGIFVGYTATDDNIRYIDVNSGVVKVSHHAVFDEAWYLQPSRPPMAQLLYDMGMESETETTMAPPSQPRQQAPWPPICISILKPTPASAKQQVLPLRMSSTPDLKETNARAATTDMPIYQCHSNQAPRVHRMSIIEDMQLDKDETFAQIYLSPSAYHEAFEEKINLRQWNINDHHTAGMNLIQRDDRLILASILPSTPAAKIDKWRSRCRGAWLMEVGGLPVSQISDVERILRNLKQRGMNECTLILAHAELKEGLTSMGIPQLHLDQFNPRYILNIDCITHQSPTYLQSGGVWQYSFSKLTRGKLVKQPDWEDWQKSEWLQLDQYYSQLMFGEPTHVKDRNNVFHLVWTYNIKDVDGRKKARCACDGSSRGGKVRVLDYTHANCVDHTASRTFYGISAAENLLVYGADVCNAFSEAPPPKQGFYIQPDRAFIEWWIARGRQPIEEGQVIPVMRAMQGHPESSRLWERHIDRIVRKLGFTPATHEPCIYTGEVNGERCIFKRQVDDFAIATRKEETAHTFWAMVDDHLTMPMKRLGLVTLFNGVDILQSRYYIKMSCRTYLEKMSDKYLKDWMSDLRDMANRPLPMPANDTFLKAFYKAEGNPDLKEQERLKKEYGFGYRSGIGEIIYAMVTCRPDVSTTTVLCSQHSACPAEIHYHAVRHAIKYLYVTRDDGIYFWRQEPRMDLPEHPLPPNSIAHHGPIPAVAKYPQHGPFDTHVYSDSNWAACLKTRRSTTGVGVKLAGGTIAYKTKLQPTVALSSTEAELMAACDAGKMILYIRSILWDLGIPQQAATIMYEDNDACTAIANAQKPTPRTRHMDIRYFALSDWVEQDLMFLERIHTSINEADHFTKILERTLFYRHVDHIMGHIPPAYSPCYQTITGNKQAEADPIQKDELVIRPPAARAARCQISLDFWSHIIAHEGAVVHSNLVYSHIGVWGGVSR